MKKEVGNKYRVTKGDRKGEEVTFITTYNETKGYYKTRSGFNLIFDDCEVELIEENYEPDYRKLLMENEIKNFKIKVSSSYIEVYKNRLMSNLYQKEIIDFLDYMESLGYEEKELVLYFEREGEDK